MDRAGRGANTDATTRSGGRYSSSGRAGSFGERTLDASRAMTSPESSETSTPAASVRARSHPSGQRVSGFAIAQLRELEEVRILQLRAPEERTLQVRFKEDRVPQLRAPEERTLQVRVLEVRTLQLSVVEIRGL